MKRSYILLFFLLFGATAAIAQPKPSNDDCIGAISIAPNGACVVDGTTIGATDSWQGSVGCRGGGNHPDVWYSFNATGSQAQFTVTTSGSWTGNIDLDLFEGSCSLGFIETGYQCGSTSTLNATFNGLQPGTTYFFMISNSNSGNEGPFTVCLTNSSPPPLAGQDCSTAAKLCDNSTVTQGTSSAGFGNTQELSGTATCLLAGERQSKWFKFTVGCSGTLGFTINPMNKKDDYDFALFNATGGCPTTSTPAIACNWYGTNPPNDDEGCIGISIYGSGVAGTPQPGIQTHVPCAKNWGTPASYLPFTFYNQSASNYNPLNVVAGNTYALLVDNFTLSNSGFTLSFEGTATIGPDADFSVTSGTCGTYDFHKTCQIVPESNCSYLWQFGDGQQSTLQNPTHIYSTFGNFVISLQVTDATDCVTTYSKNINISATPLPTVSSPVTYCVGATASPLTATGLAGSTLLWYTAPTGGVGSSIAQTPSTSTPGTTSYYVSQTISGCESGRAQIDVTVNPGTTPTFNAVAPICSGATLSPLPTSSTNATPITGSWSPALNNTSTTMYTFTPTAGQCATTTTLTITVNPILSPTVNCGVSTTSSITFTWAAVSGATNYSVSYQVNGGAVNNIGAISNVLSYQVNGLTGGDNVSITVTPTGAAGSCFNAATTSCTATACTPPTATIDYGGPFCSNDPATYPVTLNGTGSFTGGIFSALPGLTLNSATGDITPATSTPGTYTVTYTVAPAGGCPGVTAKKDVIINALITPTFNAVAPICSGATLSPLPTSSTNATPITGSWSPALNNTSTTMYTFTPTAGQCATTTTLTITVNPGTTPTFNAVAPICSGATLSPLPTSSTNATPITGSWSPALNNTSTTMYTFTPTAGQCATTTTLTITVNPGTTPTFNAVAPICSGATLSPLPTSSTNATPITGSWSPALNNTSTTMYTFTPTAGQCATTTTLTITVNPGTTPTFNAVAPICSGATLSPLPTSSTNATPITGSWSPALNNTSTTMYTFTPTAGQCATTTTLTITVNPILSPTVNCGVSTTSSITFTWAAVSGATNYSVSYQVNGGAVNNIGAISNVLSYQVNGLTGGDNVSITVTPTGAAGSCFNAATTSCTATACTPPTATIDYGGPFCSNDPATYPVTLNGTGSFTGGIFSALPGLTLNSATGDITPATSTPGTYTVTYTVAPAGGCPGVTAKKDVIINALITPTFNAVAPICSGATLSPLPTSSTNATPITGSWSPALNNTSTTMYTFTPTAGQCATTTTLTITVNPGTTPTFNAVAPICSGATLSPLPTSSTNATPITGSWSPALNNTSTTMYTFTPTAGQCATTTTLTITVNPILSPTVNCGVSTTSSITFTWAAVSGATNYSVSYQVNGGAVNNIGAIGNVLSYQVNGLTGGDNVSITVTPTGAAGSCFNAATTSCTATACTPPTATIDYGGPFCSNDPATYPVTLTGTGSFTGGIFSALPGLTLNSATGDITPATSTPGTYTVTYTVAPAGGCPGVTAKKDVIINALITPTFNAVAPICSGATLSPLPTSSTNATPITGSWSPALNNTSTTMYTFTPTAGQCATTTTLTITVNPILSPTINCGVSTTSSITFTWATVSGATGYTVSYQVNGGAVNNIGTIGNVLSYQVTGLTGGDNVSITVTPTGAAGSCFNAATTSCIATACTPPTASIVYGGPFCGNDPATYPVTLTGTGSYTGGDFSSLPFLTLNSATGDITPATSTPGTYIVTYTVAPAGGCPGVTTTKNVVINLVITPTFNAIAPICSGGTLSPLPTSSTNATPITGTWSPALNNTTTTTYTFTPTAGQCAKTTTLTITVNPGTTPTFNAVAPICSGGTLSPLPTSSTNATPITGSWSPALNNTTTTTYTFTPTAGQCAKTTTLTITVNPGTTPTFNAVAPICSGGTLSPLPTSSTNATPITGSWSPALNNTTTTTYTFTPTAGQCAATTSLIIKVNQTTTSTTNKTICANQPFTWNGQTYNAAGTYSVRLTAASGCDSVATLILTVSAAPNLKINDPTASCEPATIDLSLASITTGSDPGLSYSYWTNAAATASLASPTVNASGTYYIKGSSPAGCTAVQPVVVNIEKRINGSRYPDVTTSPNTPVQLQARSIGTGDNYIWQPAVGLNSSSINNPIFSYDKETEYYIDISTQAECATDTLQILFNVAAPAPSSNVFVPKAWTPNGDGHNDNLVPLLRNISSIKYFRIFNRWGQLVFETNTIGKGWDGMYLGIKQPIDTYTWIVEAVSATGEKITRTGGSVLLR